jgi:hypothetical protein
MCLTKTNALAYYTTVIITALKVVHYIPKELEICERISKQTLLYEIIFWAYAAILIYSYLQL